MTDGRPVVALDTNALMMPAERDVQLFEEIERLIGAVDLVVPSSVYTELAQLADEGNPAASVGRSLAESRCRLLADDGGSADQAQVNLAAEEAVDYVVTNDAALRRRILDAAVPVISLRGGGNLAVLRP